MRMCHECSKKNLRTERALRRSIERPFQNVSVEEDLSIYLIVKICERYVMAGRS